MEGVVQAMGDPEVDLATWLRQGAPLGITQPIHARGVFPPSPKGKEAASTEL